MQTGCADSSASAEKVVGLDEAAHAGVGGVDAREPALFDAAVESFHILDPEE
jgi:hypothetical protein